MTKQQICPHCRSVFEINGALDFGAKSVQAINCPVCGQEIWVDSGLWPQKWTVGKIITKEYNPAPPDIISQPVPTETVWKDFSILGPLAGLGNNIKQIAIWAVIVLVLIAVIKFKK